MHLYGEGRVLRMRGRQRDTGEGSVVDVQGMKLTGGRMFFAAYKSKLGGAMSKKIMNLKWEGDVQGFVQLDIGSSSDDAGSLQSNTFLKLIFTKEAGKRGIDTQQFMTTTFLYQKVGAAAVQPWTPQLESIVTRFLLHKV